MGVLNNLYENFDSEIVEEFLMMLDVTEDNIDIIIDDLKVDYENSINDLFRLFHNLKSATAYLQLKRIHNFAHFVENVLQNARNKKLDEEKLQQLIDWLFVVSEQFHEWYRNITGDSELAPLNPKILKIPKI